MSERKSSNFVSEILFDLTLKEEGFDPRLIGYQKKHVWATCRFCGKPNRVIGSNFKKAGSACHKECRLKEQSTLGSPFLNPEVRRRAQEKRDKTRSAEEISKRQSDAFYKSNEKRQSTCLEKYGVKNPFQSEEIKERIKDELLTKYGCEHVSKIPHIREKIVSSCIKKYNHENPCQNEEIKKKISETWSKHVSDSPGDFPIVTLLRSEDFWSAISSGETLSDVCEACHLPYQSVASVLSKEEFRERFRSTYSYPRRQKQNKIFQIISSLGVECSIDERGIIEHYEIDIFLPEKKIGIEFNGSAWHSELFLSQKEARNKHISKTNLCLEKGIKLLHIFERTWDLRQNQVMNLIKSKLGVNETIFARKCTIDNNHCPEFLDQNHIQKPSSATLKYFNLSYNGEIVGSMTAAKHHTKELENTIVLSRLCFKDGITVVGGASKLFESFKTWARNNGYVTIISWSDTIYTHGDIYPKLGFELSNTLNPDYFYWDMKNNTYISKRSQTKKKSKCPIHLTEREWAIERGLYRIWDCGKKLWTYNL